MPALRNSCTVIGAGLSGKKKKTPANFKRSSPNEWWNRARGRCARSTETRSVPAWIESIFPFFSRRIKMISRGPAWRRVVHQIVLCYLRYWRTNKLTLSFRRRSFFFFKYYRRYKTFKPLFYDGFFIFQVSIIILLHYARYFQTAKYT